MLQPCYNLVVTTPYNTPPWVVTTKLLVTALASRGCNLSVQKPSFYLLSGLVPFLGWIL